MFNELIFVGVEPTSSVAYLGEGQWLVVIAIGVEVLGDRVVGWS